MEPSPKRARSESSVRSLPPAGEIKYNVLAFKTREDFGKELQARHPERFEYHATSWKKFEDSGMDHIVVGGFQPVNVIMRSHVLFLADFHSNDAMLSQFHVLVFLCESFLASLTILLPYLPTATMERSEFEGEVATANTVSRMLSSLPLHGSPTRVMFYDLHTLQNRFYLHTGAIATLHSAIPLLKKELIKPLPNSTLQTAINGLAFPDEGAQKRFSSMFPDFKPVTCGKKRMGDVRKVVIQDGDPMGLHMLIVDDMVKSGGTLVECAKALMAAGALAVSAYVTHAGFPGDSARRFCRGGQYAGIFKRFYVSDSNPVVVDKIKEIAEEDTIFEIIELLPQVLLDI
jgi:phosphoribosylpyrophosphate synthetase